MTDTASTAQASEREQIVAWLRASGHSDPGAFAQRAYATAFADAIERGDHLATPVEPSPAHVERVVEQGNKRGLYNTAENGPELVAYLDDRAGMLAALRDEMSEGYRSWLDDAVEALRTATRHLAALQSPPVEQSAPAEAQQPSDGLVEEIERRFGKGVEQRPLDWQTRDRILAALKTRTSPETVELLREAREAHWFYYGDDCSSDRCRFGIDECISEDFEWDNAQEGDHVLQISGARPVPDMWVALHYFTEAEKDARNDDEPYTYTVHETEAEARAAIASLNTPDQGSDQHG